MLKRLGILERVGYITSAIFFLPLFICAFLFAVFGDEPLRDDQ